MSGSRWGTWVLVATLVVGIALVLVGAVVANGEMDSQVEGAYFNRSVGEDATAYAIVEDHEPTGLPWLIPGFGLLALSFGLAAIRARGSR